MKTKELVALHDELIYASQRRVNGLEAAVAILQERDKERMEAQPTEANTTENWGMGVWNGPLPNGLRTPAQEEKPQPATPPEKSVKDKRTCFTASRDKVNALRWAANLLSTFSVNRTNKIDKEISDAVNNFYRDMFIVDTPQPLTPDKLLILRDLRDRVRAGQKMADSGFVVNFFGLANEILEVLDQIFGGEA